LEAFRRQYASVASISEVSFGNCLVVEVSPVASFFLLLRQKKETKEKATPDRSTALALNSFSWFEGQGAARVKWCCRVLYCGLFSYLVKKLRTHASY